MCLCFCVYILFMNIETRIILKLISKKIKRICIKKLERYDHYDLILLYVALIRKMFCTLELDLGHIKTRSWRWLKRLCADYPPSNSILPCLATTKYCHSGDIGFQIATWPHVGHEVKGPCGFKGDFTLKVIQNHAKIGDLQHCGTEDMMVLVYHVISQDQVTKESSICMGWSPSR